MSQPQSQTEAPIEAPIEVRIDDIMADFRLKCESIRNKLNELVNDQYRIMPLAQAARPIKRVNNLLKTRNESRAKQDAKSINEIKRVTDNNFFVKTT